MADLRDCANALRLIALTDLPSFIPNLLACATADHFREPLVPPQQRRGRRACSRA